jgi:hypothetical protein
VRRLVSLAIHQSDNVAVYILVGYLGRASMLAFTRSLGDTAVYTQGNRWAALHDLVLCMKAVVDFAQANPTQGDSSSTTSSAPTATTTSEPERR